MTPEWKLALEILGGCVGVVALLGGIYKLQKPFIKEDKCDIMCQKTDDRFKGVDKRLDKGVEEFKEIHEDIGAIKTSGAVTQSLMEALDKKFDQYHGEVKKMNGNGCKCKGEGH